MCVAACINTPVTLQDLQNMEESNPHGGGVACFIDGQIAFYRGLTAKEIFELQEAGALTYPYLLHFRWATHGANVPEMCHPFVTGPRALLGELSGRAKQVLIHNGTWNGHAKYERRMDEWPPELLSEASDTAIAAYWAGVEPEVLKEVHWATALATARDDAMVIETTGTWSQHKGNTYSNLNWLPSRSWGNWASYLGRHLGKHEAESALVGEGCEVEWDPNSREYVASGGASFEEEAEAECWNAWVKDPSTVMWGDYRRAWMKERAPLSQADWDAADYSVEHDDWVLTSGARLSTSQYFARKPIVSKEASWDEYIRAKYGDQTADGIKMVADEDTVSEDQEVVNSYLARQMIG